MIELPVKNSNSTFAVPPPVTGEYIVPLIVFSVRLCKKGVGSALYGTLYSEKSAKDSFIIAIICTGCGLLSEFTGWVFSIIFNKQFIDVLPLNKTGTRIESILELLGIQNKILKNYNDFNLIDNVIDYENVNNRLENERNKSLDLLKKAIEE